MKISIVGCGHVGSTTAFALILKDLAGSLVLIDRNESKARSDAQDLSHALAFSNHIIPIEAGPIEASAGSDIVILSASVPWSGDYRTRFDLGPGNLELFRDLVPGIARLSPGALLIVLSNPLDIMTYFALKFSGFPPSRVFGVGTLIDSARFRKYLSEKYRIHPDDIRAYVLGEHGETQFPLLSHLYAGGERIGDREGGAELLRQSGQAAYDIVKGKGYTNFAISLATALVVESIAFDENRTMPLSTLVDGFLGEHGICLSMPVVVGRSGITRRLVPELDATEREAFRASARFVRAEMEKLQSP